MLKLQVTFTFLMLWVFSFSQSTPSLSLEAREMDEKGGMVKVVIFDLSESFQGAIESEGLTTQVLDATSTVIFRTREFEKQYSDELEQEILVVWIEERLKNGSYTAQIVYREEEQEQSKSVSFSISEGRIGSSSSQKGPYKSIFNSLTPEKKQQDLEIHISSFSTSLRQSIEKGNEKFSLTVVNSAGESFLIEEFTFNESEENAGQYVLHCFLYGLELGDYTLRINHNSTIEDQSFKVQRKEKVNPIGIEISQGELTQAAQEINVVISGVYESFDVRCFSTRSKKEFPMEFLTYSFNDKKYRARFQIDQVGEYRIKVVYEEFEKTEIFKVDKLLPTPPPVKPMSIQLGSVNHIKNLGLGSVSGNILSEAGRPEVSLYWKGNVRVPISDFEFNESLHRFTFRINHLKAGTYKLIATNGKEKKEASFTIDWIPNPLQVDFSVIHVNTGKDAKITARIISGTENTTIRCFRRDSNQEEVIPIFSSVFNSTTSQKEVQFQDLSEGVYYITVLESGFEMNDYVWVGKYGAVTTLTVQPGVGFGKDASLYRNQHDLFHYEAEVNYGQEPFIGVSNTTNGGYTRSELGVMKFSHHGLEQAIIEKATLQLTAKSGSDNYTHSGLLISPVIKQHPWNEMTVSWNNQPLTTEVTTASIQPERQDVAVNKAEKVVCDMTNMVSIFAKNPSLNNGLVLKSPKPGTKENLKFYSSNYYGTFSRPKYTIIAAIPGQEVFVKLKKKLDGSCVRIPVDRKLRFIFKDDYDDQDNLLTYRVYNDRHEVVMTDSDYPISVFYGTNRQELLLDICLFDNGYYTLEVENEKKEKEYVRFSTFHNPRFLAACSTFIGSSGTAGSIGGMVGGSGTGGSSGVLHSFTGKTSVLTPILIGP